MSRWSPILGIWARSPSLPFRDAKPICVEGRKVIFFFKTRGDSLSPSSGGSEGAVKIPIIQIYWYFSIISFCIHFSSLSIMMCQKDFWHLYIFSHFHFVSKFRMKPHYSFYNSECFQLFFCWWEQNWYLYTKKWLKLDRPVKINLAVALVF